ncbi:ATP-dependent DNA helicase RecG [Nocardioides sp. zg-1308]|uniref:ATP-dependent DNA helicase RecG n=1 Tax=Nocardioides sp. zg-1308 TaxID=2736253 RepID=UPI00155611F1|nr:ATP-dependent DNA helicase RecG [Nocardioides sp. zg-1308]NPD03139.1 ATP-dependent DNA helicase RecG [Nocardioides sp. zg-1308]
MVAITPDSPIQAVFGSHHKKRKLAEEGLGLATVGDLLRHFPRRYVAATELSEVATPVVGEQLTIVGEVRSCESASFFGGNRRQFRTTVRLRTDGPDFSVTLFSPYQGLADRHEAEFRPGSRAVFTGKAKQFRGSWQLDQPHGFALDGAEAASMSKLMPVYPLTAKLYSWDLQKVVAAALDLVTGVPDVFTPELRERYELLGVMQALRWIHAPDEWSQLGAAQKRFRFEEALVLQLTLARRRATHRAQGARSRAGRPDGLLAAFDERLPFELTGGQREIGELVAEELARDHPMNRLLQGEVGSGKTLVALRAMLQVVDSGGQAALLAPTEVLAQQHHRSISAMLGDLAQGGMLGGAAEATSVVLLTGSMGRAARQEAMLRIVTGEAGIVIGTHALLEDRVEFADLGLVVVDEQHRFGVEQRAALTDKAGTPPHVLVMTATPIPRTVAMTVFGDLETSVLAELPAGRAPIQTNVVPLADQPSWIERVWQRVREEVEKGHQVYVVCPRISGDSGEEGETDQVDLDEEGAEIAPPKRSLAAVEDVHEELAAGPLRGLRTAVLHGRLAPDDKDRTMRAFAAGDVDVLVSTTVIEVGVDVHNATMMVLLDADRFGVSQLHQLRGRVGRGGLPGLCLLVSHAELGSPARDRLDAVASTTDGFELSRVDLEQRREGDVLGASQSGFRSGLVTLRVLRDEKTIVRAREAAEALLSEDPALAQAPELADAVAEVERSAASGFMEKG